MNKHIGTSLSDMRRNAKITHEQLAEAMKITPEAMIELERKHTLPKYIVDQYTVAVMDILAAREMRKK
jgi:DNA-binding XRE family transcriptional regulator